MQSALLDVVVVVTVAPQSPPSPIPGIHQTRTHTHRRVCHQCCRRRHPLPPLPATSRRTGMACPGPLTSRLHRSRRLHILARLLTSLTLAANNDVMPSILSRSSTSDESTPLKTKEIVPLPPLPHPPSSPFPLQGCSLSSLTASTTLRAHILEMLFDAHSVNHSHWSLCAS